MVTLTTMYSLRARTFGWSLLTSNFNIPTIYENTQNSKNRSGQVFNRDEHCMICTKEAHLFSNMKEVFVNSYEL